MDGIDVFERLMIELRYRASDSEDAREKEALRLAATVLELFVGIARQGSGEKQGFSQ